MKTQKLFLCMVFVLCIGESMGQHQMVYRSKVRKVVKVHLENGVSVYYSEWPDTTRANVKAVLNNDIESLIIIPSSDLDSILAVVSSENYLKQEKEKQEQTKWVKKLMTYYSLKSMVGLNSNIRQYGTTIEVGIEIKDKYRTGLGSGFERIFIDDSYAIQVPFFVSVNYIILKMKKENQIYALTNIGNNFVLNADEQLGNNRLLALGMGLSLNDSFVIEAYYKMQKANATYQKNGQADLAGINLGFIF